MKVFIFVNGKVMEKSFYKGHFKNLKCDDDIVICADGGYHFAKSLAIHPDIIIGDLDSINKMEIEEDVEIIDYPEEKDYSDFELSLNKAFSFNPERVIVYGAFGGRIDHELTNVILLAYSPVPMVFVEKNVELYNVIGELNLNKNSGCIISLIPIGGCCKVIDMIGFKYILRDQFLKPSSIGLSNLIIESEAVIKIDSGNLIVALNKNI